MPAAKGPTPEEQAAAVKAAREYEKAQEAKAQELSIKGGEYVPEDPETARLKTVTSTFTQEEFEALLVAKERQASAEEKRYDFNATPQEARLFAKENLARNEKAFTDYLKNKEVNKPSERELAVLEELRRRGRPKVEKDNANPYLGKNAE